MFPGLRKIVTGLDIKQEYVCLALEEFQDPFSVYLTATDSKVWMDVTDRHLFLGYSPLIVGIAFNDQQEEIAHHAALCLSFQRGTFSLDSEWRKFPVCDRAVARLILRQINESWLEESHIVFYRGEWGEHTLLPPLNQWANKLKSLFKEKRISNVGLPGNLYDQVRIAYAVPRPISLVTLSDGNQMNMFPTDLHGRIGRRYYASSLRIGGKACNQVEQRKKIVLSTVDSAAFKTAYELGKNHMKDLAGEESFDLFPGKSSALKLPLPSMVRRYRELEWTGFFDSGIHRIFLYRVLNEETVSRGNTLAHIHCYYAQWRINHKLSTQYLLR